MPRLALPALAFAAAALIAACSGTSSTAVTVPTTAIPSAGTVSFKTTVAPLLASQCAACHTPSGRGARDAVFIDAAGTANYDQVKTRLADIITSVKSGKMPDDGTPLTADEIGALVSWQADGAPNN